jgi:general secretion pathway protein H
MLRSAGFSLIEILAVLLLVGILAGSASIYITTESDQSKLENSAERFMQIAQHVSDMAVLSGEPVGLVVVPPPWVENPGSEERWQYRWMRFIEVENSDGSYSADWVNLEGVDTESFDPEVQLLIELEGTEWDWAAGPKVTTPIFVLYPSGEAEPLLFRMELFHSDLQIESQSFQLDRYGRLAWVEKTEDFEALAERF